MSLFFKQDTTIMILILGVVLLAFLPYPSAGAVCRDRTIYCRFYSQKDCTDPDYIDYLKKNCKKKCGFCDIATPPPVTTQTIPITGGTGLQPGCGQKGPGHTRIVGGTNAQPGDWPWQTSVHYRFSPGINRQWCGGTLITNQWVLSAAHCFEDDTDVRNYHFKLGEHNLRTFSTDEQKRGAAEIHLHPNYDANTADYDMALVKLDKPVMLNDKVRTACLPETQTNFPVGTMCTISGWGALSEIRSGPAILQQAQVPLASHTACSQAYAKKGESVSSRMICAGAAKGKIDACQGDSGGPLVCKAKGDTWYIVGATSWGIGCARKDLYGVYADVKVMRKWVDKVVFNM